MDAHGHGHTAEYTTGANAGGERNSLSLTSYYTIYTKYYTDDEVVLIHSVLKIVVMVVMKKDNSPFLMVRSAVSIVPRVAITKRALLRTRNKKVILIGCEYRYVMNSPWKD
jgi:hypothetical protein